MTTDNLIPKKIKPLLYQYDEYQTYDLIVWDSNKIMRLLPSDIKYLNNLSLFQSKLLIDRFTPWNYPWCEHYSTKLFHFINEFTGTDRYVYKGSFEDQVLSYSSYGDENVVFNFPSFELRNESIVSLNIPATQKPESIVFSWLLKEENQGVIEYSKTYKIITTSEVGYIFEIDFTNFVYCSLVISSSNSAVASNIESQLSGGYLYSKFDELLLLISDAIKIGFPRLFYVIKSISYKGSAELVIVNSSSVVYNSAAFLEGFNSESKQITSVSFTQKPDYYKFVSLLYANNNLWNWSDTYLYVDLGKTLTYSKLGDSFEYYFIIPHKNKYLIPSVLYAIDAPGEVTDFENDYINGFKKEGDLENQYFLHSASETEDSLYPWGSLFRFVSIHSSYSGVPGLLDYITGQKFHLVGYGQISYPHLSQGDKQIDYYVVNTVVESGTNGSFSITGGHFFQIGSTFHDRFGNLKSQPLRYLLNPSYSGEIVYHYFDNDESFTSANATVADRPMQVLSNAEVIKLIDEQRQDTEMPDSIRIKEIHQALQADKFAYAENGTDARVANLGYYVERIARVLGISVNSDGSIRSIRQKKVIERGGVIPAGWYFGQFGSNRGGSSDGQQGGRADEERDGIVYEQRSNKFVPSLFNLDEVEIHQGDYTLCENIPQLLDEMLDDLDKALGWQDLGASAIPNADGSDKTLVYNGLAQLLTELAFTSSRMSQHTSQGLIASLVAQGIAFELLKATGQKLIPKSLEVDTGDEAYAQVPYPGIAADAPSQLEQTKWILQTLAPIVGNLLQVEQST